LQEEKVKPFAFIIIVVLAGVLSHILGLNMQQVTSIVALTIFIAGSFFYWSFRVAFALTGVSLLLFLHVTDLDHIVKYSSIDVVMFIIGMMIIVGFLEERGFFDWLTARVLSPYLDRPAILISLIWFMGFVMASLVDEVTSILFMLAITMRISRYYNVDPLPLSIFLVFTTNIGSSATVVGNPIGVLIAFRAGLSFMDFIRWSFPIALVSVAVITGIGLLYFKETRKRMTEHHVRVGKEQNVFKEMARFRRDLIVPTILFLSVITGLALHHDLEQTFSLPKNSLLLAISLTGAGAALFIEHDKAIDIVEKRVDWWTLLYFLLLFSSVGTLEYTGVTDIIGRSILHVSKGNVFTVMMLVGAVAGSITAVMDNVLAVAIVIPIVMDLAKSLNVFPVWWILLIAGTYWGNATVIGSTANIVMAGYLEKAKKRGEKVSEISMKYWVKLGVPISLITYLIAFALLYAQYLLGLMPNTTIP
jgi:Na+/H+ antiporter NhaD/arsenite permease-like protein